MAWNRLHDCTASAADVEVVLRRRQAFTTGVPNRGIGYKDQHAGGGTTSNGHSNSHGNGQASAAHTSNGQSNGSPDAANARNVADQPGEAGPMLALDVEELHQLAGLFKLLADRTRLAILQLLSHREMNVTALCDELKLPQPTVSHHLGLLRMNRLIENRRDGKQIFYSLNGRIFPAEIAEGSEVWKRSDAVQQTGNDDPTGLQIIGPGFVVQVLSAKDVDPRDFDAARAAR